MPRPRPLRPDRLRTIERPFGWIPFRLLKSGLLAELDTPAKLLYFFLCLVADPYGVSFYGEKRLRQLLRLSAVEVSSARMELIQRDLLAFDGRVYQLLSLPDQPARQAPRRPREALKPLSEILPELGVGHVGPRHPS